MTGAQELASGKCHHDENFPVASWLIVPRHRPAILAFYHFARAADDVADHPSASAAEKLTVLAAMGATLAGESDAEPTAVQFRKVLGERSLAPGHGFDLLEAFRRDVSQCRYATWDELMDYCRFSAAPVGRMLLEMHGESCATWPASDALCSALQVINHLLDCGDDWRRLDRVYLPHEELAAAGVDLADLEAPRASPALRAVIASLARRTQRLLERSRPLASQIVDRRLALEVGFIQRIAEDLAAKLERRDPLSDQVRHRKVELFGLAILSVADRLRGRLYGPGLAATADPAR
jgi:squalene synthase HpnC